MTDCSDINENKARLYLVGAFVLRQCDGSECTPKNRKAQAILAMLALSPHGRRTRSWLRSKLWSESDEQHAASCLRQTLFELRKSLGDETGIFLDIGREAVSIRFDQLWIDARVMTDNPGRLEAGKMEINPDVELLEGMDINDDAFEEWLMLERANWQEKLDCRLESKVDNLPKPVFVWDSKHAGAQRPFEIVLMPSIVQGVGETVQNLGDFVTDSVASSLAEFMNLKVVDLRFDLAASKLQQSQQVADCFIRTRVLGVAGTVAITFFVYDAEAMTLLSANSMQFVRDEIDVDGMETIGQFIGQNIDQLAKALQRQRDAGRPTELRNDMQSLIGYRALSDMFDLDQGKFSRMVKQLESICESEERTLYKGLLTYSASFALGENLGKFDKARLERITYLANETLKANPFNSISLACLGHVYGYVFGNHELAAELFNRAVRLNPMQAFVWDHLALHKLYTGNLDGARIASARAVGLGSYSPINYTYETTSCMVLSLSGDHRKALHIGMRALSKKPNFNAALRYSLASSGHLGARAETELLREAIMKNDPGFLDPEVQRNRFRLPLPEARDLVLAGISKAMA